MTSKFRRWGGAAVLAGACVAGTGGEADAQAIACGETYTVVRGDTLSQIAARAVGSGDFRQIFAANSDVLRSPTLLEVGDRIFIPCFDANGNVVDAADAAPTAPADDAGTEATTVSLGAPADASAPGFQPAPSSAIDDIPDGATAKLYVLLNAAPLAGSRLPEGGMLTELVQRALLRAPVAIDYEVDYGATAANDPADIAATGADLGYPAMRPQCADATGLSAQDQALCTDYLFSEPVYEFAMGTFVSALGDFTGADEPADLFGTRLCRPEGASDADLRAAGLIAPNVNPVTAKSVEDCMLLLVNGDVTVVSVPATEGAAAIERLGIASKIAQVPVASGGSPMHVVSPRANPLAEGYIALINSGLEEMRASGEYDAVVENHLSFARVN